MWLFSNRSKLLRQLSRLAFYNDKGIAYARHNPGQVEARRASTLARIRELVTVVGPQSLPERFVTAVVSGTVANDLTGEYIDLLKSHFQKQGAP